MLLHLSPVFQCMILFLSAKIMASPYFSHWEVFRRKVQLVLAFGKYHHVSNIKKRQLDNLFFTSQKDSNVLGKMLLDKDRYLLSAIIAQHILHFFCIVRVVHSEITWEHMGIALALTRSIAPELPPVSRQMFVNQMRQCV